jgi:hypothetical protein
MRIHYTATTLSTGVKTSLEEHHFHCHPCPDIDERTAGHPDLRPGTGRAAQSIKPAMNSRNGSGRDRL